MKRVFAHQIRFEHGVWVLWVCGDGFEPFDKEFKQKEKALSWLAALIALFEVDRKFHAQN